MITRQTVHDTDPKLICQWYHKLKIKWIESLWLNFDILTTYFPHPTQVECWITILIKNYKTIDKF